MSIRLHYVLPYIFKVFDQKESFLNQSKVVAKAISVGVKVLEDILDDQKPQPILKLSEHKIFNGYILPQFQKISKF